MELWHGLFVLACAVGALVGWIISKKSGDSESGVVAAFIVAGIGILIVYLGRPY